MLVEDGRRLQPNFGTGRDKSAGGDELRPYRREVDRPKHGEVARAGGVGEVRGGRVPDDKRLMPAVFPERGICPGGQGGYRGLNRLILAEYTPSVGRFLVGYEGDFGQSLSHDL